MRILLSIVFAALLARLALPSAHVQGLDSSGSEFFVTFLPDPSSLLDAEVKLYVATPERTPVTFSISAPGTGFFQTAAVVPGGVKEFTFDGQDYILRNTTDRSKGIIIAAQNDKRVYVYAAHDIHRATDSFLALPPHDLGTMSYTYIAAMIHTLDQGDFGSGVVPLHALIGIVSTEDDTLLTITPTRNVTIGTESVRDGASVTATLHRAETLLIAAVGDLTGTKVTSSKPISFLCGDQCPYIPSGVAACDQIVEQLPPVEAWGRKFATAPLKTRMSFDVFRIVAAANNTNVNITCALRSGMQGYNDTIVLNEGGFTDIQINSTEFCWMEADRSILLLQFAVGITADYVPSDPFMTLVPAVSHYTNSLTLPPVNSSFNDFTHYLNIIVPAEHYQPDQIFLDSQSLQSLALEFVAIVHDGETMAYATQLELAATVHTLIHGNSRGLFGVVTYGFAHAVSYGHVGGMQFPVSKPLTPPTELTVLELSPTSFTVSWRSPLGEVGNGSTLYYLVNVTDTEEESVVLLQHTVNSTVLQLRVAELLPNHVHQVSVAAVSGEETGPAVTVFVKTSQSSIVSDGSNCNSSTVTVAVSSLGSLLLLMVAITCGACIVMACVHHRRYSQIDRGTHSKDFARAQNPVYANVYFVKQDSDGNILQPNGSERTDATY